MNKKIFLPGLILAMTILACNLQINATNTPPTGETNTPQIIPPSETPQTLTETSSPQPTSSMRITLDSLKNATVFAPFYGRTVTLVNGSYIEGYGPTTYSVQMLDVYALGDLNGDNKHDAAIILAESSGGTGVFESLAALVDLNGSPYQVSQVQLGDRVLVSKADISSGVIHLNMNVHSPNDPLCCPSQLQMQSFWLLGNKLWQMRVTSGQTGVERSINITSPANWSDLTNPFVVNGNVPISPFENNLAYGVYLQDGTIINKSSLMVSSAGMGTPGTFSQVFNLSAAGVTGLIVIQFKELSAADGSILALNSVVINLH